MKKLLFGLLLIPLVLAFRPETAQRTVEVSNPETKVFTNIPEPSIPVVEEEPVIPPEPVEEPETPSEPVNEPATESPKPLETGHSTRKPTAHHPLEN